MREKLVDSRLLESVVAVLVRLTDSKAAPEQALAAFDELRAQTGLQVEPIWDGVDATTGVHFDALVRVDGGGTLSLSFAPEHGTPWPLRGMHRHGERDIVRVNGETLTLEDIVAHIDFLWNQVPLLRRIVDTCLLQEELKRRNIQVLDEELQSAIDAFRAERGLHLADDTFRWLEARGLTHLQLERYLTAQIAERKLQDAIVDGREEAYLQRNRERFHLVSIARLGPLTAEEAEKACSSLRAADVTFSQLAHERVLGRSAGSVSFLQWQPLDFGPPLRDALLAARAGTVLEPLRTARGFDVVQVVAIEHATLGTPATLRAVRMAMISDWLDERRAKANVSWYWGWSTAETPRAG